MKNFLAILIAFYGSALAVAETVQVSENGIEIKMPFQPTSFVVGDTVTLHIEASSSKWGVAFNTTTSVWNRLQNSIRTNYSTSQIMENDVGFGRKTLTHLMLLVTTFPSIPIQWISSTGKQGIIDINPIEVNVRSVAGRCFV